VQCTRSQRVLNLAIRAWPRGETMGCRFRGHRNWKNTIADLVRPSNSDRSVNSARSFLSVWLPDGVFDQNIGMMRSYGGARSSASSHVDESKFRFSHQRALQQQHFPAPPSSLMGLRAARKTRQDKSRQGRVQEGISKGLKLRRRRTMCAASKSEVVMSLRWAKRSSVSLDLRALQTQPATDGSLAASFTD
jgi:hypothetical protein